MVERVHYGRSIGAFNMHAQMECAFINKVTPSLTNMGELAPPKPVIPAVLLVQSIAVEYAKEYIKIQPMDSSILYIVFLLGC